VLLFGPALDDFADRYERCEPKDLIDSSSEWSSAGSVPAVLLALLLPALEWTEAATGKIWVSGIKFHISG
jgi:hypothetical protein